MYVNPWQDEDDFFITTDNDLYEKLAEKGHNTILQENTKSSQNGSLSVYYGKDKIHYINGETEHGENRAVF